MITAGPRTATDEAYVSELLEVSVSILERHPDRDLAEKAALVQRYMEISKQYPQQKNRQVLENALPDLDEAVSFHLNRELETIGTLFRRLCNERQ